MTVEMTTRKLESGRVSLPRAGLAALLAVTLLAGGLIGTAIYAGIGAPFAQPATGSVTLPPESMVVRDLRISAGRGPLTGESEATAVIGEGTTTVVINHAPGHGPLR